MERRKNLSVIIQGAGQILGTGNTVWQDTEHGMAQSTEPPRLTTRTRCYALVEGQHVVGIGRGYHHSGNTEDAVLISHKAETSRGQTSGTPVLTKKKVPQLKPFQGSPAVGLVWIW
jgi:hypothetical protein